MLLAEHHAINQVKVYAGDGSNCNYTIETAVKTSHRMLQTKVESTVLQVLDFIAYRSGRLTFWSLNDLLTECSTSIYSSMFVGEGNLSDTNRCRISD